MPAWKKVITSGSDASLNTLQLTNLGSQNETLIVGTANQVTSSNILSLDTTNNRVGIGTASPAYQVEIENTGANALLVLQRTDGASCFIEGQSARSAFGSVGATPLALAYNSFAVVTIGANGAITVNPDGDGFTFPTTDGSANQFLQTDGAGNVTFQSATVSDISDLTATATELNYLDGVTGITLGSANELLVVGGDGSSIVSDSTLAVDTGNNYIGINQSSPEVTLHMTGEGDQTAQIRMEQYNDSADAPDVRTRRYRGTIASPLAINSGDYLFRSNHEYWNGSALIVGGAFAFDNTNNAERTQFAVSVTTDGTSADPANASKVQFKIDGNDSGAITFNNAYKFPTTDGSINQVLQTNGSGVLSFADVAGGGSSVWYDGTTYITSSADVQITGSLQIYKSGSTVFNIEGSQGTLFTVTDELSGSLFSVNDISGIPIFEVFSDDTVKIGTYSAEGIEVQGSDVKITGSLAVGNISPNATDGRIDASNDVVAFSSSDKRWKTNIKLIESPLEKLQKLSGVEFDWIEDWEVHGNGGNDVGVIAQEVELVLPQAVQTRDSGMKAVRYEKLIPLLIETVKEQQKQIDELKNKIG